MLRRTNTIALLALASGLTFAPEANAASVLVIAHSDAAATAADLQANTSHTYDSWDSSVSVPTLMDLQGYDVVVLYGWTEPNGIALGDVVASYFQAGGAVVHGTFYVQHRAAGGWGNLENHDVFTHDAGGAEYTMDSMDPASVVPHPITAGVATLSAHSFRGGATPKMDATVLATWTGTNNLGQPDPVVAYRMEGLSCIVGIGVFTAYSSYGMFGAEYDGDFYLLHDNAIAWAANCNNSCGDMIVDPGEDCDDGNMDNTDDCLDTCVAASCGDGFVWAGVEDCDDENVDDTDDCLQTCEAASCGDGFVWAGVEDCDDGNLDDTDDCVSTCEAAYCGDGYTWAGMEECDDGNPQNDDGCLDTCEMAACGDGLLWEGVEECDDENFDNGDACLDTCQSASCGDGFLWIGTEDCDDGNTDNDDGCLDTCVEASCGDGFVWADMEECDDGNEVDDDACSNACTLNEPMGTTTGVGETSSTGADDGSGGASEGDPFETDAVITDTLDGTGGGGMTASTSTTASADLPTVDGCACRSHERRDGSWALWALLGLLGLRRRRCPRAQPGRTRP